MDAARALTCESLRLDGADRNRLETLVGLADMDRAIALARPAAVLPTLAWTLAHHRIAVSGPAGDELAASLAANAAQNAQLLADLAAFQRALDEAGIACVVLKGAALLATDRRAVACRHTDDIDLLFDQADVGRAREVALRLGFHETSPARILDHAGRPWRHKNHLAVLTSPSGTPLELHFGIGPGRPNGRQALPDTRRVRLLDAEVTIPSPAALAAHLSSHVMIQHRANAAYLPRHLVDLALLRAGASRDPALALSLLLARAALERPGSLARRTAEAMLFASGRITLERLLRPAIIATRGYGPYEWIRRLFPTPTYLAQICPDAAGARSWRLAALYARRLGRLFFA